MTEDHLSIATGETSQLEIARRRQIFQPWDALIVLAAFSLLLLFTVADLLALLPSSEARGAAGTEFTASAYLEPLIVVGLVLVAASLRPNLRRPFGLVLPAPRLFLRGVILTVIALWWTGVAAVWLVELTGVEQASGPSPLDNGDVLDRFLVSLAAGVTEEAVGIAFPLGLTIFVLACIRAVRVRGLGPLNDLPQLQPNVLLVVVGVVYAALRIPGHLYQGELIATRCIVWGSLLLVIALVCKSVVPVILGHFLFDFVVAGNPLLPEDWTGYLIITVLVPSLAFAATYIPITLWRPSRGAES